MQSAIQPTFEESKNLFGEHLVQKVLEIHNTQSGIVS